MDQVPEVPRSILQKIFISRGETRLRAAWRLLLQSLLLGVTLGLLGVTANFGLGYLSDISYAAFLLLGTLVISLAVTFSVYLARRYFDHRSFTSLGLQVDSRALVDILFGISLAGLMMGMIFLVLWALNWIQIESFAWQVESWVNVAASLLTMVALFTFVSWQEELLDARLLAAEPLRRFVAIPGHPFIISRLCFSPLVQPQSRLVGSPGFVLSRFIPGLWLPAHQAGSGYRSDCTWGGIFSKAPFLASPSAASTITS